MGALPRSRPGIRSPRRAKRTDPKQSARAAPRESRKGDRRAGLDDLVRAGASVASEAAGLGAQLAGRAGDTIRRALERR